jgi:DNA-binding transcriptional LysR family regulator
VGDAVPFAFVKGDERIAFKPPNCLAVNDTTAYLAAAVAGLGVAQGPDFSVQAAIDEGKLTPLLTDWNSNVFPVSIVYPPSRFLSAKVRVFIDWAIGIMDGNLQLKRR